MKTSKTLMGKVNILYPTPMFELLERAETFQSKILTKLSAIQYRIDYTTNKQVNSV